MIVEHFFNDKLQKTVSKLRREGKLDQHAVNAIDFSILTMATILIILTILLALALKMEYGWMASLLSSAFGLLLTVIFSSIIARNFSNNAYLLTCGQLTVAKKVQFKKYRGDAHIHESWDIEYSYQFEGQHYRSVYHRMPRSLVKKNEANKEVIRIAFDPLNPERSIPVFDRVVRRYQLSNPKEGEL